MSLAEQWLDKARVWSLVVFGLLTLVLASCTMASGAAAVPTAEVQTTVSPTPAGILSGDPQATAFDQVTQAIDKLYSDHPDVNSFVVKGVTYTPANTRQGAQDLPRRRPGEH